MVQTPSTPGLVALYSGRYTTAKGFYCSSNADWLDTPRVSVLVASQSIWIGLSYADFEKMPDDLYLANWGLGQLPDELPLTFDEYGYFPSKLGPNDRRWIIPNDEDGYDWPAARGTLLEIHALIESREQAAELARVRIAQERLLALDRDDKSIRRLLATRQLGLLSPQIKIRNPFDHSLEIAAEDEVPYAPILAAIDLAVATDFGDFTVVDPVALPQWLKE
jgi:hypothetical protein